MFIGVRKMVNHGVYSRIDRPGQETPTMAQRGLCNRYQAWLLGIKCPALRRGGLSSSSRPASNIDIVVARPSIKLCDGERSSGNDVGSEIEGCSLLLVLSNLTSHVCNSGSLLIRVSFLIDAISLLIARCCIATVPVLSVRGAMTHGSRIIASKHSS